MPESPSTRDRRAWGLALVVALVGVAALLWPSERAPPPPTFWIRDGDSGIYDRPEGTELGGQWVVALIRSDVVGESVGILSAAPSMSRWLRRTRTRFGLYDKREFLTHEEAVGEFRYVVAERQVRQGHTWLRCRR